VLLASGTFEGTVRLWNAETGELKAVLVEYSNGVDAVAFSPDGKLLASGGINLKLWDPVTGKLNREFKNSRVTEAVAFSSDGKTLASGEGSQVQLWDVETGTLLRTLHGHAKSVRSVAFARDSSLLASASEDKTIRLWDSQTGKSTHILTTSDEVHAIAFSPDGSRLASGTRDAKVQLWDTTVPMTQQHNRVPTGNR
jgi:WD40 repeat protein